MAIIETPLLPYPSLQQNLASSEYICIVFWAASYENMFIEQTIKTNVIGTLNMLGLAKRVGAR